MAKKHVILFAGTTEGRILANWLDEQSGVTGIVCVATEYGAELLEEEMSLKHLTVHCGRLDEGAVIRCNRIYPCGCRKRFHLHGSGGRRKRGGSHL